VRNLIETRGNHADKTGGEKGMVREWWMTHAEASFKFLYVKKKEGENSESADEVQMGDAPEKMGKNGGGGKWGNVPEGWPREGKMVAWRDR